MTYEQTVKLLNDLLIKNCDAEQGYQHSAGKCDQYTGIFYFLESQSEMRQSFAREISKMIARFGAKPDYWACFSEKAHQAWDRLRSIGADGNRVLVECKRGEEAALEIYDRVLACENLPSLVRDLLLNQREQIGLSLAQIKSRLGGGESGVCAA